MVSPVAGSIEPSPSASPSPSPTSAPAYAVMVDLLTSPQTFLVSLVGAGGKVLTSMQADQRSSVSSSFGHPITLPYVSTSSTTLYWLDGNTLIRSFRLSDGTQAEPTHLDLGSGEEGAFAVSPDDSQIAVSVLDFNRNPVHVTLYVDSIPAGHYRPIFESDTDYVWPVAWHGGLLVLAHAYGPFQEDVGKAAPGEDNPYSAISYHLVDPATARRVVLMGACTVSGPLSPAGSGCIQGGTIDWAGNTVPWSPNDWGSVSSAAALSPDGQWVAATPPTNPNVMAIYRSNGNVATYIDGPGVRDWAGWLDDQTIVTGSYSDPAWTPQVANVIRGGVVYSVVAAHGFYAARLPTNIV